MDNKHQDSDFSDSSSSSSLPSVHKEDKKRSRSRSRDSDKAPKTKTKNKRKESSDSNHSKKANKKVSPIKETHKNRERDDVLRGKDEISLFLDSYKRLNIRKFKGKLLVDIREFYFSEGEMKPGKKGIALSEECWKKLCSNIDFINESINEIKNNKI